MATTAALDADARMELCVNRYQDWVDSVRLGRPRHGLRDALEKDLARFIPEAGPVHTEFLESLRARLDHSAAGASAAAARGTERRGPGEYPAASPGEELAELTAGWSSLEEVEAALLAGFAPTGGGAGGERGGAGRGHGAGSGGNGGAVAVDRDLAGDSDLVAAIAGDMAADGDLVAADGAAADGNLVAVTTSDLAADGDLVTAAAPRLPVRNEGRNVPGHVTVFRHKGGLVHGGVVQGAGSLLVCRACLYVEVTNQGSGLVGKKGVIQLNATHAVGGVCEVVPVTGPPKRVMDTNPYPAMARYFRKPGESPPGAFATERRGKRTRIWGHYVPMGRDALDVRSPPEMEMHNKTGVFHKLPPALVTPENPTYDPPRAATAGFPIHTAYVSVFAPAPGMDRVVVSMLGAGRRNRLRVVMKGIGFEKIEHDYDRRARWVVRTVRL